MRLYNTLHREIEEFTWDDRVRLYVCGVTPYDTTHLGHARTYLTFDVLIRTLLRLGAEVDYVQNITDVDDSIIQRAEETGEDYRQLGDRFTMLYLDDLARLGALPARDYPRATGAIAEMVTVIEGLHDDGFAYEVDGDVFFRSTKAEGFGNLSRLSKEQMVALEREQDLPTVDDPRKEDPLDILLWRHAGEGEPAWESPWGRGRPGWHIECSVLTILHQGPRVDIHGGGDDLVFPHHEAEIVQSETYTGMKPFARFWMHVAMVRLDGKKMSKSEGNMIFVSDLLKEHTPDAIRLYTLSEHYRTPLDHSFDALARAAKIADRITTAAKLPAKKGTIQTDLQEERLRFDEALENDLDVPAAIGVMEGVADRILTGGEVSYAERRVLREMASALGLQLENT